MQPEETLDPDDWTELRTLGHKMIDEMIDYIKSVREQKTWYPIPEEVKESYNTSVPYDPSPVNDVYEEFKEKILPYRMGNIHPRFWGWVIGTGSVFGSYGEFLNSIMNSNLGGGDHSPVYIELQVLNWMKELFGFPKTSSGLLVSGGSMANFICLTVARNAKVDIDIRKHGLQQSAKKYIFYTSTETHSSNYKAIELLGIGKENLHTIDVDQNFKINIDLLKDQIKKDKEAGYLPVCIIANIGTVNSGAIDDITALSTIANAENMWLHADGAFGAVACLSEKYKHLVKGIELADSLAFDFHKWFYIPYEAGCVLIKDADIHYNTFSYTPIYLAHHKRGVGAGPERWFSDYGIELSRGFKALKIWMSFKEHGIAKYGRLVTQNIDQAKYLESLIKNDPGNLELVAPVELNLVCFRFNPQNKHLSLEKLNELNQEILFQLQENGIATPSYTTLSGKYAIRVANTNHRSRREDFDILVENVLNIGTKLVAGK